MAQDFAGFAYDSAGNAVVGATVNLYDRNTVTPSRANTTTDGNGYWTINHATEGRFDVAITSGNQITRIKYDSEAQMETLEGKNLRLRNPANTFRYDIVPGAITAGRTLNLPVITGTDTLMVLALNQTVTGIQTWSGANIHSGTLSFSSGDATWTDNVKATFGTGGDADVYYDATDLIINPAVAGAGDVVILAGGLKLRTDSEAVFFGAGVDASILYDGTNLVINPKVVGSGLVSIAGDLGLGVVKLANQSGDPGTNGYIQLNGTDIKVYTGGSVVNLSAVGGATQANQAAVEAQTNEDTYVAPDFMKFIPGAAKAWVRWEMTGAHSILVSHNMTSVTDGGAVGETDHLWNIDMSGTQYVVTGGPEPTGIIATEPILASTGCSTRTFDTGGNNYDSDVAGIVAFGDHA
jgi:hypothetical protein